MRERIKFKDIRALARERAKEDLNTLILIEVIVIIISIGIIQWNRGFQTLIPFLPVLLLLRIAVDMLTAVFWTGNIFACMMVAMGVEAKVEYIFYVFQKKSKEILWLLLRKVLVTKVYIILFSCIADILSEIFQLEPSYMGLVGDILAITVVELRYFPALYLLLDGEEQKCGLSVKRGLGMMHGNYLRLILCWCSFLPWILVGFLLCGLGLLVVGPWVQVSLVIFYVELKQQEKIKIRKEAEESMKQDSV